MAAGDNKNEMRLEVLDAPCHLLDAVDAVNEYERVDDRTDAPGSRSEKRNPSVRPASCGDPQVISVDRHQNPTTRQGGSDMFDVGRSS